MALYQSVSPSWRCEVDHSPTPPPPRPFGLENLLACISHSCGRPTPHMRNGLCIFVCYYASWFGGTQIPSCLQKVLSDLCDFLLNAGRHISALPILAYEKIWW